MLDMVLMKNKLTGTNMYVAKDRVNEYVALGHILVGNMIEPVVIEKKEDKLKETSDKLKKTLAKTKKKA